MLKVENLTKYYGENKGIENVSFQMEPGEILGVLGHNGSGKTTLFRVLLSLISAQSGSFSMTDTNKKPNQLFGYVPEARSMYKDITVTEQITYLAKLRKMKKQDIELQMMRWLTFFEMKGVKERKIKELSKGNQQKVQFICAIVHNPDILILDEPLNGLDGQNILLLKKAITLLSNLGKMILMSSHQYEELEEFCHQVILLRKGDVILKGNLKELKRKDPRRYVTINHDLSSSFKEFPGVLSAQKQGLLTRYVFDDEDKADNLVSTLLENPVITYLRMEHISLRDLVGEASP